MQKKNFILFYLINILIFVFLYLLEKILSVGILILLPFYCAFYFYRSSGSIIDFRFIYSISLGIWGGAKCIPILNDPNFTDYLKLDIYPVCMILASGVPFLFQFYQINKPDTNLEISKPFISILWFILVLFKFVSYLKFDYIFPFRFIFDSLLNGLYLVITGLLLISFQKKNIFLKLAVFIILLLSFNIENFNRTSVLLPIAFILLIYGIFEGFDKRFILVLFISPFLLFIADLQKQTQLNILSIDPDKYYHYIINNTYLPSIQIATDYFKTFNNLFQSGHYFEFSLAKQIIGIFIPRIIFDEKAITNISSILWTEGLSPGPLYYEIFLEYYYDSWFLGIVLYNLLIVMIVFIINRNINYVRHGFGRDFLICTYALNLIVLFYVIRGPFIFYVWVCLIPNTICLYLCCKNFFRKYLV